MSTENQFADPNQPAAEALNATARFKYPLPVTPVVPFRKLKFKDYGFVVADPRSNNTTSRVIMFRDSQLTRMFSDASGLSDYTRRETVFTLGRYPELLSQLAAASTEEALATTAENVSWQVKGMSYGNSAMEWSSALIEWINHIEYGGTESVPAMFVPYVQAYLLEIYRRGWKFDPELSNRYITNAAENGIMPKTPVFSNTGRVYRDVEGNIFSLQLSTASNINYRLISMTANAGFASNAVFILGQGTRGTWIPVDEGWSKAQFGVVNILRSPSESGEVDIRFIKLDASVGADLAQTALDVQEVSSSNTVQNAIQGSNFGNTIVDEIRSVTDVSQLPALYNKYKDFWLDEYTQLGKDRAYELQAQTN